MENLNERTATELFELIYLMPKEKIRKIPAEFLELLHEKKAKIWRVFSSPDEVNVKNLSEETKNYLSYIYLNYILDGEEKESYKEILNENEKIYQEKNADQYDISKKLKAKERKKQNKKEENRENLKMTVKEEKNILTKILEKIKNFFKRLQK